MPPPQVDAHEDWPLPREGLHGHFDPSVRPGHQVSAAQTHRLHKADKLYDEHTRRSKTPNWSYPNARKPIDYSRDVPEDLDLSPAAFGLHHDAFGSTSELERSRSRQRGHERSRSRSRSRTPPLGRRSSQHRGRSPSPGRGGDEEDDHPGHEGVQFLKYRHSGDSLPEYSSDGSLADHTARRDSSSSQGSTNPEWQSRRDRIHRGLETHAARTRIPLQEPSGPAGATAGHESRPRLVPRADQRARRRPSDKTWAIGGCVLLLVVLCTLGGWAVWYYAFRQN